MTSRAWPWLALLALLACAWWAYAPGLHGGFLFDDFNNLDQLASPGPVDDWAAFWRYITSGSADPTGRPLALLSFLIDARDWPADPWPFLRTNVLLHLANAALLFVLLRQLGRRLDANAPEKENGGSLAVLGTTRNDTAALLGAGIWALHPLFVSTTLYIVQREAMLPATFTLLGLLSWGHGRDLIARSPRAGAAWMVGGIGLGTLFGMSCKANGALLPLLAWVLDATVYCGEKGDGGNYARRNSLRPLFLMLLVLPSLLLCAYVLKNLAQWSVPLESRPWTIGQRVLTEPRVLLDYLRLLVVPRVLSTGVYNDGYAWSTGLLHPASTLPALLGVLGLITAGFALRRRSPALAAALLFYFAGHLLESTTIPLELYFEHRNYLPAMLLGWPLARGIVHWRVPPAVRGAAAVALLALMAATTWQRATLWGQPQRMAMLWVAQNPQSSRAQATAASAEIDAGHADAARRRLLPLWHRRPDDLQLGLNYANAACATTGLGPRDIAGIAYLFERTPAADETAYNWLTRAIGLAGNHGCRGLDADSIERWLAAAWRNPEFNTVPGRRQDLEALAGQLALLQGRTDMARLHFEQALAQNPTPDLAASKASQLASAGAYRQALALLDRYDRLARTQQPSTSWNMGRLHAWVLKRQGYWPHEFAELRRKIHEDLATAEERP